MSHEPSVTHTPARQALARAKRAHVLTNHAHPRARTDNKSLKRMCEEKEKRITKLEG